MDTSYTFIYCLMHDCGCIIRGYHKFIPEGYKMEHSTNCEYCDWYNMGVISYDGNNINIIEDVRINFNRYCGDYKFNLYASDITDENGKSIIMDDDSPLVNWIESVYQYSKNTIEDFITNVTNVKVKFVK